ncbi:uncharacterized protein LOC135846932 isoform X2 [Planococcus citri]|uniref:uncharacterized protein LOC135846932 isoform X2 n=1 Tax=Planococcus citri TaxID=170843 RepID=UPI0031F800B1
MYCDRILLTFLLAFYLTMPLRWVSASVNFFAATDETFSMKFTGKSVEALGPHKANGTITHGFLSLDVYQFHKLVYYWVTNNSTHKFTLHVEDIFFNRKYGSYQKAFYHPDGIVQVCVPVFANALIDNPLYYKFEEAFNKIKNKPGKTTDIISESTYSWIMNFFPGVIYVHYKSRYFDEDSGKSCPYATTIMLPIVPSLNFISSRQYLSTFGSLVDSSKRPLNDPPPLAFPRSFVGIGINIILIHIKG